MNIGHHRFEVVWIQRAVFPRLLQTGWVPYNELFWMCGSSWLQNGMSLSRVGFYYRMLFGCFLELLHLLNPLEGEKRDPNLYVLSF